MLSISQTILKSIIFGTALIFLTLPAANVFAVQSLEIGIITAGKLHIRSEPGLDSRSLRILRKGTEIRILDRVDDAWLKISYQETIGYIRNRERYVHILPVDRPAENRISDDKEDKIDRFKKEAKDISQKIKKGRAKVLTFTKKESTIVSSLDTIDLTINKTRKRVSNLKGDLITIEKQIAGTTRTSKDLVKNIEASEEYVYKRLVSLYKLNWVGRLNVLASAEDLYGIFQRKKNLELILGYDQQIREKLIKNKLELQTLLTRLNNQKMEKLSLETDLNRQDQIMSEKRTKRAKLLDDIRSQRLLEMAAIESLKQAARNLDRVVKSLSKAAVPPEQIKKTGPKSFTSAKGLLNMPVKGKITYLFGPYTNEKFGVVNFRSGVIIKAERGEPIRAVHDGRILYASWLKGYGNMIIIDHGENYYTVYAHAEELFASKGDNIEKGEVVATVGDTGSLIGAGLHFEVRHHGRPVDPLKWIKAG